MADTTIAVSSILTGVQPYVTELVGAVIVAAVGYALTLLRKWLGVQFDTATVKEVDDYLTGLAAKAVAAAEDNLATRKIDVHSELVQKLATEAITNGPAALDKLGLGPDDAASKIASAFGKLQAQMTYVAPPVGVTTTVQVSAAK